MTKVEKCIKRTNYVLGYTKPKFTQEEIALIKSYQIWQSWTPNNRSFRIEGDNLIELENKPIIEKPNISVSTLEKSKMYDNWCRYFNSYYDKL
jgi:hypothetical protein